MLDAVIVLPVWSVRAGIVHVPPDCSMPPSHVIQSNSDHIGEGHFGHYSEVGLISEVLFVMGVFAVIIGENEF